MCGGHCPPGEPRSAAEARAASALRGVRRQGDSWSAARGVGFAQLSAHPRSVDDKAGTGSRSAQAFRGGTGGTGRPQRVPDEQFAFDLDAAERRPIQTWSSADVDPASGFGEAQLSAFRG